MPSNLTWQPTVVASSLVFPGTRQVSRYALKKKPAPAKTPPIPTRPSVASENREPAQRLKKKKKSSSFSSQLAFTERPSIAPAEPPSQTTQPESDADSISASLAPSSPAVSSSCSEALESESASESESESVSESELSPPLTYPSSPVSPPCKPAASPTSAPSPFPSSEDERSPQISQSCASSGDSPVVVGGGGSSSSSPSETVSAEPIAPGVAEAQLDEVATQPVETPAAAMEQVAEECVVPGSEPEGLQEVKGEMKTLSVSFRRKCEKPKVEVCEWLSEGLWSLFAGSRTDATLQTVLGRLRPSQGLRASDEMQYAVQTREGQGEVYEVLRRALEPLGWRQTSDGETWNLLWTWQQPVVDFRHLLGVQKVNHFRENKHLTRKDYLKRSQDRYIRFSKSNYFRIYPETYILPKDYSRLIEAFAEKPDVLYIMKPVGSSRGRGVKLISELSEISYSSACIVQRYIERPVLYKGFKFDLRIYVLVTSFAPLHAYIYKQGFARLATVQYSLEEEALKNKLVHVTNVAVQMHTAQDKTLGTKLTLDQLKYSGCFGPADVFDHVVWPRIKEAAIKALVFASHNVPPNANSFELFGFDILVERDSLRVWVLEVNSSPSMSLDTPIDQAIKVQLIRDTVLLVDPIQFDRNALEVVIDRRRNSRIDRNAKLSLAEAQNLFLGKAYANSYPDACEPAARRLGDFEVIAPSELYSKVAHEARNVVNPS